MVQEIYNSTFTKQVPNNQFLWKNGTQSTVSSIEESYRPEKIKIIVDDLVLSKFGNRRKQQCLKMASRRSRLSSANSDVRSDISIETRSLSDLVSHCESDDPICIKATHQSFEDLGNEGAIKNDLWILLKNKYEILKAINWHRMSGRASLLEQRLEAEKLLLINNFQTHLVQNSRIDNSQDRVSRYSGTAKISDLRIHPIYAKNSDKYFLCLLVNESKVYASEVAKVRANGFVHFNKSLVVSKLHPNFHMVLMVFCISIKNLQKRKTLRCDRVNHEPEYGDSLFELWGTTKITRNFNLGASFEVKMGRNYLSASVSSTAQMDMHLSAFLDIGAYLQEYPFWNRQWCVLNGRSLLCYNYPSDGEASRVIDIGECLEIRGLRRDECARKFSILLRFGEEKFLVSCHNENEYNVWRKYLRIVKIHIQMWERK